MTTNILIDILSFGEIRLNERRDFQKAALISYLLGKGHPEKFINFSLNKFLVGNFDHLDDDYFRINTEGYLRLLNYKNLEIADQGLDIADRGLDKANESLRVARRSFWIASGLGAFSIILSSVSLVINFYANKYTQLTKDDSKAIIQEKQLVNHYLEKAQYYDSLNIVFLKQQQLAQHKIIPPASPIHGEKRNK